VPIVIENGPQNRCYRAALPVVFSSSRLSKIRITEGPVNRCSGHGVSSFGRVIFWGAGHLRGHPITRRDAIRDPRLNLGANKRNPLFPEWNRFWKCSRRAPLINRRAGK
jgi:hypothetical protein